MVLVEPDRIATMACLPPSAQRERYKLLQFDMRLLSQHPNAIVYLDAGGFELGQKPGGPGRIGSGVPGFVTRRDSR